MDLDKYINEFKKLEGKEIEMQYDNNISFPYIKKPDCVIEFIEEFYTFFNVDTNYEDNIRKIKHPFSLNSELSKDEIETVLSYCVRKDRFIEGFFMEQVTSGLVSKTLIEYKKSMK